MKCFKILFIVLSSFLVTACYSQVSPFHYRKYTNDKGDTLLYRFLESDYNLSRNYPLVIFLHGSGERGNDNEAQLKWGVLNFATDQNMKLHPAYVIAPQCPPDSEWAQFTEVGDATTLSMSPEPSRPMKLLIGLIDELVKNLPIDKDRIYITGLSSGGAGTYDALARYPHLFAAAVPVCGEGDVSIAPSIKHIPIWIFHGAEDPAVDAHQSFSMVEALIKAGAHPGYTLYPETGHFSWLAAYSDPMMMEWLFRQHK
jgi:predicted peptidase